MAEMRNILSERYSPDITSVNVKYENWLDDPTFLTKVKLRFKCPVCENKWGTFQGTVKC